MAIKSDLWRQLLDASGIPVAAHTIEQLQFHEELVTEWNQRASLVSRGDLAHLWERHIVDSVSLAPIIAGRAGTRGGLLDVGSGAGFPAIPVKIVLPELEMVLIERSETKVAFLRRAIGALGLTNVTIQLGEFPHAAKGPMPDVITARAVEKPDRVLKSVLRFMPEGCVFLCQSGEPGDKVSEKFHVEHIKDIWSREGLRRGELYLISRKEDPSQNP